MISRIVPMTTPFRNMFAAARHFGRCHITDCRIKKCAWAEKMATLRPVTSKIWSSRRKCTQKRALPIRHRRNRKGALVDLLFHS
jgi:hypothetical protein